MNTRNLLKYHWKIFLAHVCEFHPLDKVFIEQYAYELDWHALSKNKTIDWSIDFLSKYEPRFLWHELAVNESILWTADKVEQFKKRLDWDYLGHNKNLPITESFIEKYARKLVLRDNHPMLSEALVKKYNLKVFPAKEHDTQEIKSVNPEEIDNFLNTYPFYHNQKAVYEVVCLPIIEEAGLASIFNTKFDYAQRYYFLSALKHDIHGLTPEFKSEGYNPFQTYTEGRNLLITKEPVQLVNGPLQEGPARLYDMPRFATLSYYATILVSENVRAILEQFKLPPHTYHDVILTPKKITTSTKYYILQLEFDTLNKDLQYANRSYDYAYKNFNENGAGPVTDRITNYAELTSVNKLLKEKYSPNGMGVIITPDSYALRTDYDMYSYSVHGKTIIINQYLKDALEKNFPDQLLFESAQLLHIKIDQGVYDQKAQQPINTRLSSRVKILESANDVFYYTKMERLQKSETTLPSEIAADEKFAKKERELLVVFPRMFMENYLNKRLHIEGYEFLPISKFYIEHDYAARHPESYKSVVVAENGSGDSIHLLLERNSDYQLQNRLFEFFHETGEYEEL